MRESKSLYSNYDEQIKKFLDEFIEFMYKGHDHIIARKYFGDLFNKLIPKYFCLCEHSVNDDKSKLD